MNLLLANLASTAEEAARAAAQIIKKAPMDKLDVRAKSGGDSIASQIVTQIDLESEAAILEVLEPTINEFDLGLLTEEREDDHSRLNKDAFWCIDPLDGTLPFSECRPGYAVSIALVARDGKPLIGMVIDPCADLEVLAVRGQGCRRNGQTWETSRPGKRLGHFTDQSTCDQPWYPDARDWLVQEARQRQLDGLNETTNAGGVVNALRVLEQSPGCYFKFPRSTRGGGSLWDYAATACIFAEMGATACDFTGSQLDLNRKDDTFLNHHGILFASDSSLATAIRRHYLGARSIRVIQLGKILT